MYGRRFVTESGVAQSCVGKPSCVTRNSVDWYGFRVDFCETFGLFTEAGSKMIWVFLFVVIVSAYKPDELVSVWADRVGPWSRPRETYSFEELPLCELWNTEPVRKPLSLGATLEGRRAVLSPRLQIHFPRSVNATGADVEEGTVFDTPERTPQEICRMRPTKEAVHMLNELITEKYFYSYEIDGLDVYGFIGTVVENEGPKFYAHRKFIFEKNQDKIISVSILPSEPVTLRENAELRYTYEAMWIETKLPYTQRLNRYYTESFFERKIQWFSLCTSTLLAIVLVSMVAIITSRTIKSDFAAIDETEAFDPLEEAGWKLIAKEVFRKPSKLRIHSILCGSGAQIATAGAFACVMALLRAQLGLKPVSMTLCLWLYLLSQPVNGFVGSFLYRVGGGRNWKSTAAWQLLFFPLVTCALFLQLNTAFLAYGSTMAVSIKKMALAALAFALVPVPLHYAGVVFGRAKAVAFKAPVKPNTLERPIPPRSVWTRWALPVAAGVLPFGCLFVELYFVMDALWTHRTFFVFGFLSAVLLLYVAAVVCSTVTATYVLLNTEDYKWQWFSFLAGGSPALYVFLYSMYYKSRVLADQTGFFASWVYWISTSLICIGLGLASGAIGHIAVHFFVRRMYMTVKSD